jgi:hypothetical protein
MTIEQAYTEALAQGWSAADAYELALIVVSQQGEDHA